MNLGSPEHIEHLGSEAATRAEKHAAVTNFGRCLICDKEWASRICPHDEIQVIAMLRGQLDEERGALASMRKALEADAAGIARDMALLQDPTFKELMDQSKKMAGELLKLRAENRDLRAGSALVVAFDQDPDGRWSATARGAAAGSVSGTATKGKALHALAYVLEFEDEKQEGSAA